MHLRVLLRKMKQLDPLGSAVLFLVVRSPLQFGEIDLATCLIHVMDINSVRISKSFSYL